MSDYIRMYEEPRFVGDHEEVMRLKKNLEDNATYDQGVARWKSNGRCIPADCAAFAAYLNLPIDEEKTAAVRQQEDEAFFKEYRKRNANRKYTAEEMYEMDAAFGPGQKVVDIITGKTYKTRGR